MSPKLPNCDSFLMPTTAATTQARIEFANRHFANLMLFCLACGMGSAAFFFDIVTIASGSYDTILRWSLWLAAASAFVFGVVTVRGPLLWRIPSVAGVLFLAFIVCNATERGVTWFD